MSLLMVLTGLMVALTIVVAVTTARNIAVLKARLARLGERQEELRGQLADSGDMRQAIEGTRDMLKKILQSKREQRTTLEEELQEWQERGTEDRDISISKPLTAQNELDFSEEGGPPTLPGTKET